MTLNGGERPAGSAVPIPEPTPGQGSTAYLAKPYSPRELLQMIRQLAPES